MSHSTELNHCSTVLSCLVQYVIWPDVKFPPPCLSSGVKSMVWLAWTQLLACQWQVTVVKVVNVSDRDGEVL